MKHVPALAVLALALAGCTTIDVQTPDGFTARYATAGTERSLDWVMIGPNGEAQQFHYGTKPDPNAPSQLLNLGAALARLGLARVSASCPAGPELL